MGILFSSNISDKMKKNQELKMQEQMKLQLEMQERQAAMQIAKSREFCNWFTAFYVTAAVGMLSGYRKTKKPYVLAPLMPLTFAILYNIDLAYGTKIHRIKLEAQKILANEADLLKWPGSPPSSTDEKK